MKDTKKSSTTGKTQSRSGMVGSSMPVASGSSATGQSKDAISLLKADHRKVEQLFQQYEKASDNSQKSNLAKQVCQELIVHTKLEEEIFYPTCREEGVQDDLLDEAQVEHDSAKIFIADIMNGSPEDEFFDAKVSVLCEYVKHHVGEEEKPRDGILAKAQQAGIDMNALGTQIQARKAELMERIDSLSSRPPKPRSLHLQASNEEEYMNRYRDRDRDEYGRFTSDDDDDRRYSRSSRSSRGSRYEDDDDGRRYSRSMGRERDEYGRIMSDDDDDRGYSRGRRGSHQGSGWYGDPEEHSEASRRGWEERGGMRSRSSRYYDEDDDYRRGSRGGRGGWFGDPEGHSEASHRGWEERGGSRSRSRYDDDDDDRRGYSSRGGRGEGHGGWFGDPEGHSEASRRGWRNR
jgi:hypothetical protein